MNVTKRTAFRVLMEDADAWRRMDDAETARRTRFYLRRLARLRTTRATYPLRKWLHEHNLLQPAHVPEKTGTREAAEHLVSFYESFWWDISAPIRIFRDIPRALPWKRLWRRLWKRIFRFK